MREISILDILDMVLQDVPLEDRGKIAINIEFLEDNLNKNVETVYQSAIQRLIRFAYFLEWGKSLDQDKTNIPSQTDLPPSQTLPSSFVNLASLKTKEIYTLNNSFSSWIKNKMVRDLDEYLQFFLLNVYEACVVAEFSNRLIKPIDIAEGKAASKDFESKNLEGRLKALRKKHGIKITHKPEVLSLNKARHVFAHFDGIVQKKSCDKNGKLTVSWPVNKTRLKNRHTKKWSLFDDVPKPFSGDEYSEIEITWLNDPKIVEYKPFEPIELSHSELNQLLFFYLYVINELQRSLVNYIGQRGIKLRPFEKYELGPTVCMISEKTEL